MIAVDINHLANDGLLEPKAWTDEDQAAIQQLHDPAAAIASIQHEREYAMRSCGTAKVWAYHNRNLRPRHMPQCHRSNVIFKVRYAEQERVSEAYWQRHPGGRLFPSMHPDELGAEGLDDAVSQQSIRLRVVSTWAWGEEGKALEHVLPGPVTLDHLWHAIDRAMEQLNANHHVFLEGFERDGNTWMPYFGS